MVSIIDARTVALGALLMLCGCEYAEQATDNQGNAATEQAATTNNAEETAAQIDYFVDESGSMGEDVQAPVEARLAAYHTESGNTALVVMISTTDGRDIEAVAVNMLTERDIDGLILVAGGEQQLAIVGRNIENGGMNTVEQAMIDSFDADQIPQGFEAGVDYLIAQLDS